MPELRHFELLENLPPFGTARAVLLRWNGQTYVRTSEVIDLFESVGSHGNRLNRGFARYFNESDRWEAVGGIQEPSENWMLL